jgi:hypothetical protein
MPYRLRVFDAKTRRQLQALEIGDAQDAYDRARGIAHQQPGHWVIADGLARDAGGLLAQTFALRHIPDDEVLAIEAATRLADEFVTVIGLQPDLWA